MSVNGLTPIGSGPFRQVKTKPAPEPSNSGKSAKPALKTGNSSIGASGTRGGNSKSPGSLKARQAKVPASVYQQVVSARKRRVKNTNTLDSRQT